MPDPFDLLLDHLSDSKYLADIFHILHLDEVPAPNLATDQRIRLLVPESLDSILASDEPEAEAILNALVVWARPEARRFSSVALANMVNEIRARYRTLRQYQYIEPIPDQFDPVVAEALESLLPPSPSGRGIVERMKAIVRESVTSTLSWSKSTGMAILMRGRSLVKFLQDRVTQIEFPSKTDAILKKKTDLTAKLFAFKGGPTVKFFVGIGLGAAGLFSGAPPVVAYAGFALAFVDP